LTLRDEIPALLASDESAVVASHARMFEEFIADRIATDPLPKVFKSLGQKVWLHGHCHQKALSVMPAIEQTLALLPDTEVEKIETSCCGMAGAFGYGADTYQTSLKMAELDLLPAIRAADKEALIVADGTSCRHQIIDNTDRKPMHVARLLEMALKQDHSSHD